MRHMELVRDSNSHVKPVYIPHHPVQREDSLTTRLRVVFNASSVTSTGASLNDCLLGRPKLQRDIAEILIRWRQHRYVYIADIAKMFRQILVHPDDADYQRIVWRPNKSGPVKIYRLLTVTYGTACAPYLALRVLLQLAKDENDHFPEAAQVLRDNTYVDDVLFGSDDIATAFAIRDQLNTLMSRGGFHLRKWAANHDDLVRDIPDKNYETALDHSLDGSEVLKVLGLTWLPADDVFRFQIAVLPHDKHTKRSILSFIARLFDPLGWAAPVVISAKLLMQDLWLQKLDWDEPVPSTVLSRWENYYQGLPKLITLRIPRWTGRMSNHSTAEIHGFSDASQRAYSAVVYLRISNSLDDSNFARG
ncbi:unnamed protein product [Lasius platythorax]|uniref:Reverse transcriptase domain-containing protein n=1 Tax=Lasius platythorax TaxID=488582 RepID=A0AAV2MVU0_9HYME